MESDVWQLLSSTLEEKLLFPAAENMFFLRETEKIPPSQKEGSE